MTKTAAPLPLQNRRDSTLDALKGLGIVLMVVGHSGVPFDNFIYLFHMALFFMVSGYLWSDRKVADIPTAGQFVLSRVKGLWIPFALCNGSFTLLHNLFLKVGIYTNDPAFQEIYTGVSLTQPLGLKATVVQLIKNMLLAGDTQLGGATWFLRTLFAISIAHLVLRYIAVHWKHGKKLFAIAVFLTLAGTAVLAQTRWQLPMGAHSYFSAYTAFLLGMLLKRLGCMEKLGKFRLLAAAAALGVLLLLNPLGTVGISSGSVKSLLFFIIASVAGWFMMYPIAQLLPGVLKEVFAYMGRHSLSVVLLHFLAFKAVTLGYLYFTGGDMVRLARFPVLGSSPYLWVLYTVAGLGLPLAAQWLVSRLIPRKKV